ncbi:hypothetical protein K438DRAFT_1977921 [Mycena galopus ATCC 62051]|nr:hypothetical protein K438DRAFT_1977921 [Mycena galopus ATCC 62051]
MSVVLQAENTQFRAHCAVNSSFFCELQELPQPPDQPIVDDCPVVEVHDSVADVEYLLTALYDPSNFSQPDNAPACGRWCSLGRKYDFKNLLDSAVERITLENPTTLEKYEALLGDEKYKSTRILHCDGYYFDFLILARENNILSALPIAYYLTLRPGSVQLFDGF